MGATAALGILTVGSSMSQASAQSAQGEYTRRMSDINARNADIAGADAIDRGNKEATNYKKKVKGLVGSQRAAMAAQGIDVNSGSALDIQSETEDIGAMDAMTIKNNAMLEAMGYKSQANASRGQGVIAEIGGNAAARNTILTGGMNALSYGISAKKK